MSRLVLTSDVIGTELSAIATVRRAVRTFLGREGLEGASMDVLLVVSELVTNSLIHTGAPPDVVVQVERDPHCIQIEVTDRSRDLPVVRAPGTAPTGGHGLSIVGQLSTAWGVRPTPGGKTTWAEMRVQRSSN